MKPAKCDTMLRAMIIDAEALTKRHIDVLGRDPDPEQDYEVHDLRDTIKDAKEALAELERLKYAHMTEVPVKPISTKPLPFFPRQGIPRNKSRFG